MIQKRNQHNLIEINKAFDITTSLRDVTCDVSQAQVMPQRTNYVQRKLTRAQEIGFSRKVFSSEFEQFCAVKLLNLEWA